MASSDDSAAGCGGCLALILAFAGLFSLAAIIDPFAWMPPIGELWAECDVDDPPESCNDDIRDPMLGHAIVNLLYLGGTGYVLFKAIEAGENVRETRRTRFDGAAEAGAHAAARTRLAWLVLGALAVAALPILAAAG